MEANNMRVGKVIIGANYGDEGKGLMTDYLVSQDPDDSIVVRFNGGAQAGHTVVLPNGRRHIFSHFGAGSLVGCPTYLSRFFIVNPLLFVKELKQLHGLSAKPSITMSDKAMVTTPFDMFINQTVERRRGITRHGSCGLGINETVTRCLQSTDFRLLGGDLNHSTLLFSKLMKLGRTWFFERLKQHQVDFASTDVQSFINNMEPIARQFVGDVELMLTGSIITTEYPRQRQIIFEGAQGLMLDEDRIDQWPHVTRSKTGLANVVYLAHRFGLDKLEVTYVSRTYLTRHGAGPLPGECSWKISDLTNVTNRFQGNLRFASLDCHQLRNSIQLDLSRARLSFPAINANIAMTCADQIPLPDRNALPLPLQYVSYGPRRSHVLRCSERSSLAHAVSIGLPAKHAIDAPLQELQASLAPGCIGVN